MFTVHSSQFTVSRFALFFIAINYALQNIFLSQSTGDTEKKYCNRSQVQGSTFRVKDKDGVEDPKSSSKMLISRNNCQFGFKFWIRPNEAEAFPANTHLKCSPGTRMES